MSTKRFLLQKILQLFLTLFLVTAIAFILMKLSPIDAAEAYARRVFTVDNSRIELIREEMGLNRPLVVQYLDWINPLLSGTSYGWEICFTSIWELPLWTTKMCFSL